MKSGRHPWDHVDNKNPSPRSGRQNESMTIEQNSLRPPNPDFGAYVANSFAQQPMSLIGARLARVEPGVVEIELPFRADLTQQDGFLHAGVITTVADSAAGYAAYTLMPAGSRVRSIDTARLRLERAKPGLKVL
jgi:acyl-coenzyme A thioesterase PaaI-like protein